MAGPARSEAAATLEVEHAPGAESCADARALADKVRELEPSAELRPGSRGTASIHLRVEIERRPEHWRAHIVASGAKRGDRTLTDSGESCAGLGDAVALTIAMLIAPDVDEAQTQPIEPKKQPQSPPKAAPVAEHRRPAREPAPLRLALRAGPAAAVGLLARPGLALFGDLELGVTRAFGTSLGVLFTPAQSIEHGPGHVDVSLTALTLSACVRAIEAGSVDAALCTLQAAGQLRGTGHDYSAYTDSVGRPWLATGAGARASGPIAGPIGWTGALLVLAPLTSERFAVEGVTGTAYEPSPVALVAEAGLRVSIW